MKALEDMILSKGKVLPGNILKVGSFLNHNIDTSLLSQMADEVISKFADKEISKVMTVEASGIAFATAIGLKLSVPVVYAKKSAKNVSGDVYSSKIFSYTHKVENTVLVPKEYISENDKLLVVDDFLASGNALKGLIDIIEQSKAEFVGCAIEIEKGFEKGGDELREKGIRVESLAIVDSMENETIIFRK